MEDKKIPMNPFLRIQLRREIQALRERAYRLAWSWCHDSQLADDLVQDTLERALRRVGNLRDESKLEVWVISILHNRYKDHLRQRRIHVPVENELISASDDPEQDYHQRQLIGRTRSAILRLSDDQRQVLTLIDLAGFSYGEVAEILEVPAGTVMSRLSRARSKLKELLESEQQSATVIPLETRR